MIDWSRVAEPQPDGYDTQVVLEHAAAGRYKSSPVCSGPLVWPDGRARWLLDPTRPPSDGFVPLPLEDEVLQLAVKQFDLWPEVRRQCAEVLIAIAPMSIVGSERGGGHGCSCGQFHDDFGWVHSTVDDPWGLAEGVVHEMAHWKLRALGIWFEEWTPLLLTNDPSERYDSPVRKDILRPVGAVLHGQYSYVHVAEMVVRMLAATPTPRSDDREWVGLQLRRIAEGQATLRAHARGTFAGADFLAGLDAWTTRVLERGQPLVAA